MNLLLHFIDLEEIVNMTIRIVNDEIYDFVMIKSRKLKK